MGKKKDRQLFYRPSAVVVRWLWERWTSSHNKVSGSIKKILSFHDAADSSSRIKKVLDFRQCCRQECVR